MSVYQLAETGHPIAMLVAVAGALTIGLLIRPVTVRVLREKVRRLTRSVRTLTDQLETAEQELRDERALVDQVVEALTETRRALRSVLGSPHIGHAHHLTTHHARQIAARPLPGESTGAHAVLEETTPNE